MFNRREQAALLLLTGALLVGSGLAVVDFRHPAALEEFRVAGAAVEPPGQLELSASETAADGMPEEESGPIDLNAATAAQLQELPGVGPKTAARILEYRRLHGPFRNIEALQQVRGVGERTVEKIRPQVRISSGNVDL